MPPLRPSAALASPAARPTLALLLAVAGVGAFAGAVWPMTPEAPVVLNGTLSVVAAVLVVVVLRSRDPRCLHAAIVALVAGLTAVVACAASPGGTAGTAVSYVWIPLYAGFFCSRSWARFYVLLSVASFAGALWVNPFPGALHVWALTTLTAVAAVEVVGSLVSTLQRQATTDPLTGLLNREGLRAAAERLDRAC